MRAGTIQAIRPPTASMLPVIEEGEHKSVAQDW